MVRQRPIAIDLFSGVGGLSLGFEQAGCDIFLAVEKDYQAACAYKYNFPHTEMVCSDIASMGFSRLAQAPDGGEVDMVIGGPPCQGFSVGGKGQVTDPRNALAFNFYRAVAEIRPKCFVMENVKGLLAGKHSSLLDKLLADFRRLGYAVRLKLFNASDYGVPQRRERVFIIGFHGVWDFDVNPGLSRSVSVREAIADLPDIDRFDELKARDWIAYNTLIYTSKYSATMAETIRDADNPNLAYHRHCNRLLLTASMRTTHSSEVISRFRDTLPGQREPVSLFYKLDPDGLAPTLRAGSGSHTAPRPIHYDYPRCISVREAARLHSFPDWFGFTASKLQGFRQVGNSVPPLMAKAIAKELVTMLGYSPSKPSKSLTLLNRDRLLGVA